MKTPQVCGTNVRLSDAEAARLVGSAVLANLRMAYERASDRRVRSCARALMEVVERAVRTPALLTGREDAESRSEAV